MSRVKNPYEYAIPEEFYMQQFPGYEQYEGEEDGEDIYSDEVMEELYGSDDAGAVAPPAPEEGDQ